MKKLVIILACVLCAVAAQAEVPEYQVPLELPEGGNIFVPSQDVSPGTYIVKFPLDDAAPAAGDCFVFQVTKVKREQEIGKKEFYVAKLELKKIKCPADKEAEK